MVIGNGLVHGDLNYTTVRITSWCLLLVFQIRRPKTRSIQPGNETA